MATKNKKEMTLDDLAIMVARGFQGVEDRMASKIELAEFRLETNARFDEVNKKIGRLEHSVEEIREVVSSLEELAISDLQKRVKTLEQIVRTLSKRLP